jgi:1-acyl-sn-glycerol-3-phosphate acyltransferase
MAKIHENNRFYNFLLRYSNCMIHLAYRKVEYRNLDKIPTDGAIILAPNHSNTLMDALVVHSISNQPKIFVARADVFKNATAAKILHFLKMLPINRIRDGVESLAENDAIMTQCIDALCDGVPFCILPEGRHRTMHSLLPLKKGIVRIAFGAWEQLKDKMPVYIVPIGLEYEDYFDFRSRLLVEAGRPIRLQDFVAEHPGETEQELYRHLLLELADRMKETILYLPDDERYEGLWEAVNRMHTEEEGSLYERRKALQRLADRLAVKHPRMLERMQKRAERRKARGIHLRSAVRKRPGWRLALRAFWLLLTAPFAALFAIPILPALLLIAYLKGKFKDKAFLNSVRYVSCWVLNPLVLLPICLLLLFVLPWWACLLLFAASFIAPCVCYDWSNGIRYWISDLRYLQSRDDG